MFTFDVFKTNTDDSQIKIYTIQVVQKPYKENVFFLPLKFRNLIWLENKLFIENSWTEGVMKRRSLSWIYLSKQTLQIFRTE